LAIPDLHINGERLKADFDELAQIGETVAGGISRVALSNEDLEARAWFANRIDDAGLEVRDDDVGNLSGVLRSKKHSAKTLLIGSHLDSIPNGGRYDGTIGVLAGLECLRTIKAANLKLPCHLEVVDFTDEEGSWQSLFGSRGMAGRLTPMDIGDVTMDNTAFRAALSRAGISPYEVTNAKRDPKTLYAYLELHIEQGNRLEQERKTIGVVTNIVGRSTLQVTFLGQAGHSGTTAREQRRDALQGAAYFIMMAHQHVRETYAEGIFNCGNISVKPGAYNIIPEQAILTVECRHVDEAVLAEMEETVAMLARACANDYLLSAHTKRLIHMPAAKMAERCMSAVERSAAYFGLPQMRMVSYAGHDAQIISSVTDAGMIFIPSLGGISRNPREFSRWEDVVMGANVLLRTILDLALNGEK
jgi:beta-ureidopropionase / N-carbamoyl-L-amino-acid hydrolase